MGKTPLKSQRKGSKKLKEKPEKMSGRKRENYEANDE